MVKECAGLIMSRCAAYQSAGPLFTWRLTDLCLVHRVIAFGEPGLARVCGAV